MIVNELLHQQFDAFKKREISPPYTIYLEVNELFALWRPLPLIHRFGQKYVTLDSSDVDELCEWVLGMREKFYQEGTKIFAPSTETNYTTSQKEDNDHSSIPTLKEKPILGYKRKRPNGEDFKGQPPLRSDEDDYLLVEEATHMYKRPMKGNTVHQQSKVNEEEKEEQILQSDGRMQEVTSPLQGELALKSDVHFNDCLLVAEEIPSSPLSKLRKKREKQMQKNLCKQTNFQVQLTDEDLEIVRSGRKLTDAHMLAVGNILKDQFPHIQGHQHTGRSQDLSFVRLDGPFIQILNNERNHWLTVEGVDGSLVRVYDSLCSSTTASTKLQIASIVKPTSRSISVHRQKMHSQTNAVDCGLFAIAYATDLAHGNNPATFV